MAFYDIVGIGLAADAGILDVVSDKYKAPLSMLLPNGPAWPRDDATLQLLIEALTLEYSRIAIRSAKLGRELDPATTFECVADWEASYGLPDCAQPETLAGRRAAIAAKLLAQTGHTQSSAYWKELFSKLGYGLKYVVNGQAAMTCVDGCMDELLDEQWSFVWSLIADSGIDDALLECVVNHNAWIATYPIVHHPWSTFSMMIPALRGVACTPSGFIAAVGDGGLQIYAEIDLETWTVAAGAGAALTSICAVDETLIAVGSPAVAAQVSVSGGASWSTYATGCAAVLYGISRGPEADEVAVAVGASGTMIRTPDAGANWAALAIVTAQDLAAVTRCAGAMVAVGGAGVVLRSVDNGATFAVVAGTGIAVALTGVSGWGSTVVAVGDGVWRSADAGLTWDLVHSPVDQLYAVTSSPSGRWTACGAGGLIVQSLDDGITWTQETSPTTDELFACCAYLPGGRAVLVGDTFVLE